MSRDVPPPMRQTRLTRLPTDRNWRGGGRPKLVPQRRCQTYSGAVSDAASNGLDTPTASALLPRDLTADELTSAPVLASIDTLLIDDLSDEEDDAFAAAVGP
jgi:hypothetical protein